MTDANSFQNLVAQLPTVADLQRLAAGAPQWASGKNLGYLVLAFIVVSFLSNILLYRRKRNLELKAALEGALVRKQQTELKISKAELAKAKKTAEVQDYKIKELTKLLDKSSVATEMRKIEEAVKSKYASEETNKGYWERIEDLSQQQENPLLKKLVEEKGELEGMIEITKMKYHTRAIDEKSFSNITEEYQKRLIELESKIKKMQGEGQAARGIVAPQNAPLQASTPRVTEEGGEDGIRRQLQTGLEGIGKNAVVLVSAKSGDQNQVISDLLEVLVAKKGMSGVYVSFSRPYEAILSAMDQTGTQKSAVRFIDCISQMTGKLRQDAQESVTFVENPSSLEEVSMQLDRALAKIRAESRFIILDSLSSLLIYNDDKSVKEFTHVLINKIRLENVSGVILSVEKRETEDLVKTLAPMCDAEIRL